MGQRELEGMEKFARLDGTCPGALKSSDGTLDSTEKIGRLDNLKERIVTFNRPTCSAILP